MAYLDGQLRDLGPAPEALLAPLIARVTRARGWVSRDPHFMSTLDDTAHIVLRFPDRYPAHHAPASYAAAWADWSNLVAPVIAHYAVGYGAEGGGIAKILLSRLAAGGSIATHVDENPASRTPHKIHLPLVTDPAITFTIGGMLYHLACGRAYEVNNMVPHSVENPSAVARIHLIFELYPLDTEAARADADALP